MASKDLQDVIELLASRDRPDNPTIEDSRTGFEQLAQQIGGNTEADVTSVDADGVPAEWVAAHNASDDSAILYLHGGGYAIGSVETHRELAARISQSTGSRVLTIDYRMAPENPFPAAVEDATNAYRWLLGQGVNPRQMAIAGDSAGGGLAVATLVSLRDAGGPMPACSVLMSPWVDMEGIGETMASKAGVDPMVGKEGLIAMAGLYLDGADPRTPLAAPLYADLTGLPPTLIHVGTWETLLSDSTRLAEKAESTGVDVTLEQWDEMIHVWHIFAPILPEGQQAIDRIGEFVRQHQNVATAAD
ncbi:MAG: alpha/beta hydrolase [SAR202 cluster bacterium]|jgi:acetyl esterase/lipase|nr:alpha/beta hydrolase [SAR202 cluster bacterium]